MQHLAYFRFSVEDQEPIENQYCAELPAGLVGSEALLQALYDRLDLPGYFGFNWNALSDCLQDLHWLKEQLIVLRHKDIPRLPPRELRIYLEILEQAVCSWQNSEQHSLRVEFPASSRMDLAKVFSES